MTREIDKDKQASNARRGLHHADDVVPQRLLLLVLVLPQRDVAVVGQVLPVGRLDVCRQAEEGVACGGEEAAPRQRKQRLATTGTGLHLF